MIRRVRSAEEGRVLLDSLVGDLTRDRRVALVALVSPAAVVTGAARGIGAATVDALVAAGWQVVAVDRTADDPALDYALATKADLEAVAQRHGAAVRAVVGDVRSASDMQAAVDEAVRHFGGLQAAVAAAGVISGGPPVWETADAQWDVQFDVNVKGCATWRRPRCRRSCMRRSPATAGSWPSPRRPDVPGLAAPRAPTARPSTR